MEFSTGQMANITLDNGLRDFNTELGSLSKMEKQFTDHGKKESFKRKSNVKLLKK